jgi:hypothetical protein
MAHVNSTVKEKADSSFSAPARSHLLERVLVIFYMPSVHIGASTDDEVQSFGAIEVSTDLD